MTTLRVATFNIRNGLALDGRSSWPLRRRATAAAIAGTAADLIGLQEVHGFQLRWLRAQLPDLDWVGAGRNRSGRGEHCPVGIRRDRLRLVDHATRWYGGQPDRPGTRLPGAGSPRIATLSRVEVAGGGAVVQFAGTHLDQRSGERRRRSAVQLVGWLDGDLPRVVVGDLNDDPDSEVLRILAGAGLRQALPPEAGGTNHDFTGQLDGRRLDHVLVSRHFEVTAAEVRTGRGPGGRLPSDHWPVVAELLLA